MLVEVLGLDEWLAFVLRLLLVVDVQNADFTDILVIHLRLVLLGVRPPGLTELKARSHHYLGLSELGPLQLELEPDVQVGG